MATPSRNPTANPQVPGGNPGGLPAKDDVCTTPLPNTKALPPPLPPPGSSGARPVAVPTASARTPLIARGPVVAAALLSVVLIGALILVIRRTPAPAEPTASPEVAQAASEVAPAGRDLPGVPPAKVEPVPAAPAAPEPPAPAASAAANPADAPAPPAPPPAPAAELAAPARGEAAAGAVDHRFGTRIDFEDDPAVAAEKALKEKKLLFVLHVAGNFEKDCFNRHFVSSFQFVDGTLALDPEQIKTVPDLVAAMKERRLKFAAAVAGDEPAYLLLRQALAQCDTAGTPEPEPETGTDRGDL